MNGAQRAIQSGKRADVIAGLETIRNYLANAENAFSGKSLSACNSPGASILLNQPPCDPVPYIKRGIATANLTGMGVACRGVAKCRLHVADFSIP